MTLAEYVEQIASQIRCFEDDRAALIAERLDDLAFQIRSTCSTTPEEFRERYAETLKQAKIDYLEKITAPY